MLKQQQIVLVIIDVQNGAGCGTHQVLTHNTRMHITLEYPMIKRLSGVFGEGAKNEYERPGALILNSRKEC
jgi:hypothetical protein